MTLRTPNDDHEPTTSEDNDFVNWVRRAYEPGPRTQMKRVTFNERLEARLQRRLFPWRPLGVATVAATLILGLVLADSFRAPAPPLELARRADGELLLALAIEQSTDGTENEMLPDGYATLASLLADEGR